MNAALMEQIAGRLGLSAEETAMVSSGNTQSVVASQLAKSGHDPILQALIASMTQSGGNQPPQTEDSVIRLRRLIKRLRADLDAANQLLAEIANVFGACEVCWGETVSCPRCRGHGRPGSAVPIQPDLMRLVEPALERLGLRVVSRVDRLATRKSRVNPIKENEQNER
jgi:hypothetical protein